MRTCWIFFLTFLLYLPTTAFSNHEDFPEIVKERTKANFGKAISRLALESTYSNLFEDGSTQVLLYNPDLPQQSQAESKIREIDFAHLYLTRDIHPYEGHWRSNINWKTDIIEHHDSIKFYLNFLNSRGSSRGSAVIVLIPTYTPTSVDQDGRPIGVEMHIESVNIDSSERGKGFSKKLIDSSINLLKSINTNPANQISLEAFSSSEAIGAYAWAKYFEYSDEQERSKIHKQFLRWFKAKFITYAHWIKDEKGIRKPVSEDEFEKIKEAVNALKTPLQLAQFDPRSILPKNKYLNDDATGKKFLMTQRVSWYGSLNVH